MSKKAIIYLAFALIFMILSITAIFLSFVIDPTGGLLGAVMAVIIILILVIGIGMMGSDI